MIQKKICMLGASGVGKTSTIRRFIDNEFQDRYLTTIGVKIEKKIVRGAGQECTMMIWDLAGEDEMTRVRQSYLKNMAGFLLVADGTRRATLDTVMKLRELALQAAGDVPFVLLLNKSDLVDEWELDDQSLTPIAQRGWSMLRTSAKTGQNVEEAFNKLASFMLSARATKGE